MSQRSAGVRACNSCVGSTVAATRLGRVAAVATEAQHKTDAIPHNDKTGTCTKAQDEPLESYHFQGIDTIALRKTAGSVALHGTCDQRVQCGAGRGMMRRGIRCVAAFVQKSSE